MNALFFFTYNALLIFILEELYLLYWYTFLNCTCFIQVKLSKKHIKSRWEEDYQLVDNEGLFEEYLEMGMVFIISIIIMFTLLYYNKMLAKLGIIQIISIRTQINESRSYLSSNNDIKYLISLPKIINVWKFIIIVWITFHEFKLFFSSKVVFVETMALTVNNTRCEKYVYGLYSLSKTLL